MNLDFLSVDYKMAVNAAGRLAMSRPDSMGYDFITVTLDETYYGIVNIKDLADIITHTITQPFSLSIAGVMTASKNFIDVFALSKEVSRIKNECK